LKETVVYILHRKSDHSDLKAVDDEEEGGSRSLDELVRDSNPVLDEFLSAIATLVKERTTEGSKADPRSVALYC